MHVFLLTFCLIICECTRVACVRVCMCMCMYMWVYICVQHWKTCKLSIEDHDFQMIYFVNLYIYPFIHLFIELSTLMFSVLILILRSLKKA